MKLRIKGNDIRYRLTRSDISKLGADGRLEEHVEFARQPLVYELILSKDTRLSATFENGTITLILPKMLFEEWEHSDRVGFEGTFGELNLLIEKDFVCIDRPEENQQDYFPNPILEGNEKRC